MDSEPALCQLYRHTVVLYCDSLVYSPNDVSWTSIMTADALLKSTEDMEVKSDLWPRPLDVARCSSFIAVGGGGATCPPLDLEMTFIWPPSDQLRVNWLNFNSRSCETPSEVDLNSNVHQLCFHHLGFIAYLRFNSHRETFRTRNGGT